MRYEHYIRPLKAGKLPSRVCCVDCDGELHTDPTDARVRYETLTRWHSVNLRLASSVYSSAPNAAGETVDGFWGGIGALLARPGCVWIISPRASRVWALLDLWERMEAGDVYLDGADERAKVYRGGRGGQRGGGRLIMEDPPCIAMLRMRGRQGMVVWVDTANYGVPEPALAGCATQRAALTADWFRRAADAVVRLHLGGWHATAGSQALSGWRTGHLTHNPLCHNIPKILAIEREAYIGGRCEAWIIGRVPVPVWHLDYRSLYPSIMYSQEVPTLPVGYSDNVDAAGVGRLLSEYLVTATVKVEIDEPDYPYQTEGRVLYPTGKITTTLCDPELRDAHTRGRVRGVVAAAWYRGAPALQSFATAVCAERAKLPEGDKSAYGAYIKRLAVCLSGKLGQSEREWRWEPTIPPTDWYGEWYEEDSRGRLIRYRAVAGVVQSERQTGWAHDAVPSIAAYITSAGRMKLLSAIRIAGWENVWYYDTDSLFVSDTGMQRLQEADMVQTSSLGMLRVLSPPKMLVVWGAKHYLYDSHRTCAGLPRGRAEPDPDGIHYWYEQWAGGQAAAGERPTTRRVRVRYEWQTPYKLGIVNPDGTVRPHHIEAL